MLPALFPLLTLLAAPASTGDALPAVKPLPQLCTTWNLDEKACAERIAKAGISCARISEHRLAGLEPAYPAVACNHIGWNPPDEYVNASGCKFFVKHQYVFEVDKDGKKELVLVKTKDEFVKFFGPVDSPAEAVGFLAALTETYATAIIPKFTGGSWKVEGIRPSTVVESKDGYVVRMFQQGNCGCYIPFLNEITFTIGRDGKFTRQEAVKVWEDDPKNEICVD